MTDVEPKTYIGPVCPICKNNRIFVGRKTYCTKCRHEISKERLNKFRLRK